jgi:hypothetical protein
MGPRRNYLSLVALAGVVLLFVPGIHRAVPVTLMLAPWLVLALLRRLAPPAPAEIVVIDDQVVRASGSTSVARFVCWTGVAGEALVAATPSPRAAR